MKGCRHVRSRLGRLLDNELSEKEAAAIRSHLVGCPACSGAAAQLRALEAHLDQLPLPPLPPGMLERTVARARQESPAFRPREDWGPAWRSWPIAARLAASAAMAAACSLGLLAGSTAARRAWRPADRDVALLRMDAGSSMLAAYTGESR